MKSLGFLLLSSLLAFVQCEEELCGLEPKDDGGCSGGGAYAFLEDFMPRGKVYLLKNTPYHFNITVLNHIGEFTNEMLTVDVNGPSKSPTVQVTQHQKVGRYLVTVIPKVADPHQISFFFDSKEVENSPVSLISTTFRDPYTIDDQIKVVFGKMYRNGTGDGQLSRPMVVRTNSKGQVIIIDHTSRVQIFDKNGKFITVFGTEGSEPGQFRIPSGLAVDVDDNIYVADKMNHRVQVFDPEGQQLLRIVERNWDLNLDLEGTDIEILKGLRLHRPSSVAVDHRNGNIIVLSQDNSNIQIFDRQGRFLNKFGQKGEKKGEMNRPSVLVVNSLGEIFVSELRGQRVQVFNAQGESLRIYPVGRDVNSLSLDNAGNIYFPDFTDKAIKILDPNDQDSLATIADKLIQTAPHNVHVDRLTNLVYVVPPDLHAVLAI